MRFCASSLSELPAVDARDRGHHATASPRSRPGAELALGHAEEELLEACGLGHERRDADPRLAERDRQRRDGLLVGREAQLAVDGSRRRRRPAGRAGRAARALGLGRAEPVAGRRRRQQLVEPALVDDPAFADDRDPVAELLDLGQQMAREQDRDPLAGQAADEVAHVAHAGRVEAGGRLVEQEQLRMRAGAPRRSRAAAASRASSRRPCPRRGRAARRARAPPRSASASRRRRTRRAAAGCARRSGTGRSAALRRSRRRRRAPSRPSTCGSRPKSSIEPSVGLISPSSIRSDVVLPAPFGPR